MTERTQQDQNLHDNLIRRLAAKMTQGFHSIRADVPNSHYQVPESITAPDGTNHLPDLTAYSGNHLHIYEIETASTVADHQTSRQWRAFAAYAGERPEVTFHIVVPEGTQEFARLWLKQLNLRAEVQTINVRG